MIEVPPAAIPAATLILLRGSDGGLPEVLMVERSAAMTFAPGALVFPGGRVDSGDRALAETTGAPDLDEAAARIAAIRETIEEVGLAIGVAPDPAPEALDDVRRALHRGEAIGPVLAAADLSIDPGTLVPFARWRPSHRAARIYDARFYLAYVPDGGGGATVDRTENVGLFWASASDILDRIAAGDASVIFPTRRTLERLAGFPTIAAAFADAAAYPVTTISPWIETREGVETLCIPGGLGYPVTAEPLGATPRG